MKNKPNQNEEPQSPRRRFVDVPDQELFDAVVKMVTELGISLSAHGYSLYDAIIAEKEKAKAAERQLF